MESEEYRESESDLERTEASEYSDSDLFRRLDFRFLGERERERERERLRDRFLDFFDFWD